MDALELPLPIEVSSATKLIGSVTVKELEACKTGVHAISASEVNTWTKIVDPEPRKQESQHHRKQSEAFSAPIHDHYKNGFSHTPKTEALQSECKAGKLYKNGSCQKRPRVIQLHEPPLVDGLNDMSQKFGSCTLKCSSSEKTQLLKQKSNLAKRGDKRSPRVAVKNKNEPFSVKAGLTGFGSAAGGNNFFGAYGLKSDNHDITKLIDDVPLSELLDGNYESASLCKDRGKKTAVGNESFLHLVRKSCSVLQAPRSSQCQNTAETDSCSVNTKMAPWLLSSVSAENGVNGEIGDSSTTDNSFSSKDIGIRSETHANPLALPLYEPINILQRLALPPARDLDSLLLDAAKPPVSSKNNTPDMRSGKQIARKVSLPPFPWSNSSSAHSRSSSSDVVKLPASKGTCQGRWLRIENAASLGIVNSEFTNLESVSYDKGLVPSAPKVTCLESEISPKPSTSHSMASCSKGPSVTLGNAVSEAKSTYNRNAGNCPKLFTAAQTLYDIATQPPTQNPDRPMTWPKKSSQKAMKARKPKPTDKPQEPYAATSTSAARSDYPTRHDDPFPPKKPRLTHQNNKRDLNGLKKEPINWSAPRSSRTSPGKTVINAGAGDVRYSAAMPPPPMRAPANAPSNQHKMRKLMPFEWSRGRNRLN